VALGLGVRDEDVVAAIMGSDEFFARLSTLNEAGGLN
jgi:hypothetical protein